LLTTVIEEVYGKSCKASNTLLGVIGSCNSLAPVALKIAFATTAPMQIIAGSPPPCGGSFFASIKNGSILGNHENFGSS